MHRLGIVLALAFLTGSAQANELEQKLAPKGGLSCWERRYDEAHLASHPKQHVTAVRLSANREDDGRLIANLGFNLRKRIETGTFDYATFATCTAKGSAVSCETEWDSGRFTLDARPDGKLLLRQYKLLMNPANYASEDIAPDAVDLSKSDDAAFVLAPIADAKCEVY
jgi:hypothetical protein